MSDVLTVGDRVVIQMSENFANMFHGIAGRILCRPPIGLFHDDEDRWMVLLDRIPSSNLPGEMAVATMWLVPELQVLYQELVQDIGVR